MEVCSSGRLARKAAVEALSTCLVSGSLDELSARVPSRLDGVSATHSDLSDVLPAGMCLRAELSVGGGGGSVSTRAEVVGDSAERDQETLCVLHRLEPLEYPFAFTRRQVRVFSTIVQPLVAPMLGVRQRPSNGWRVAGKLVGDHDARLGAALAVKHPTQETLGSHLVASLLDQDVQYEAV